MSWRRTARAGAALALLLLALPGGVAAAQDTPTPGPSAEPEAPVVVEVRTLAPRAPQPGGRLEVGGVLRNTGSAPVSDLRVTLRVGDRLRSRSELALAETEGVPTRRVRSTVVVLDAAPLAPGATRPFDLRDALSELPLRADGAYPLEVEARGRIGRGGSGDVVGLASTFLPWFAAPPTGTTRIAWLWPLVAEPVQAPRRTQHGLVLLDDELAASLAPGGRLGRSLRAARGAETGVCDRPARLPEGASAPPSTGAACRGEPVPVTYALDGDLLDTVTGMAGRYDVRTSARATRPGGGQAAAQGWLRSLREAVAPGGPSGGVVALPYADPDVVSLTGPGSRLAADVGPAVQLGRARVAEATGAQPLSGLAVAPAGALTGDALEAYLGAGARSVVVTEDALPPRPAAQSRTSGARNPLPSAAGRLAGLVVDAGLSDLVVPDASLPGYSPRLAEQRWLVESAMVSAEDPAATRTLVVAPARSSEVVAAVAAQAMLDTGRLPWLCPVALADVVQGSERCPAGGPSGASAGERGDPVAPTDEAPALPREQLDRVATARSAVDQLTGAVLSPSAAAADTRSRLLRAALRAESSAWRSADRQRRGRLLAELLQEDVDDLLGRVALLTSDVTLTSSRGQLSVDVENQLDQAVTVRVRLSAGNAARLAVSGDEVQVVPPRTSTPVDLQVLPRTSGKFPVQAQLLDRRGQAFGSPSDFVVRSTRYGTVALAVTGVGAGVLLAAAGVRLARRGLRR